MHSLLPCKRDLVAINVAFLLILNLASSATAQTPCQGLRAATEEAKIAELSECLADAVRDSFDQQIERLQTEIDLAQERLEHRKKNAEEIIARRLADLKEDQSFLWDDVSVGLAATDQSELDTPTRGSDPQFNRHSPYQLFLRNQIAELNHGRNERREAIAECKMKLTEFQHLAKAEVIDPAEDQERRLQEKRRAEAAARTMNEQIAALQQDVTIKEKKIALLTMKLSDTDKDCAEFSSLCGKVESVSENRIHVTLGSDAGIKIGTRLKVFRDDLFVNEIEIVEVFSDSSTGVVTSAFVDPIRSDDDAVLLLDPQLREILGSLPGEPIFNDQIRRFKFRLRNGVGSVVETAQRFMRRYLGDDRNPPIYGMWGDPANDSIIVIARPESEMAIREFLIRGEVLATTGFDVGERHYTLEDREKDLSQRRRIILDDLADSQLQIIDRQAEATPDQTQIASLRNDINELDKELELLDRKLAIVSDLKQR